MTKEIPPMINDQEIAKLIEETSERAANFIEDLTKGNFFIGIFMKGSMQGLWGLIRALQIIALLGLVNVSIPIHMHTFLKVCVVFSSMDIFNSEEFYEENFKFKKTDPIGSKWEFFEIGDSNFVNNSGSYFVMLVGILLFTFGQMMTHQLCVRFSRNYYVRIIGMQVYSPNY